MNSLVGKPKRLRFALLGVLLILVGGGIQSAVSLRSTAAVAFPLRAGVETFSYEDAEWKQLTETGSKIGPVVISPNVGPGTAQNADWLDRVQRAQAAGQTVYGWIDVSGTKAPIAVLDEASRYKFFYGVDGFYLAGLNPAALCGPGDYLGGLVESLRSIQPGVKIGITAYAEPNPCVETLVDLVHIPFSNPTDYAAYASITPFPNWTRGMAAGSTLQIWHTVSATSSGQIASVKASSTATSASYLNTTESVALTSQYWAQMVTEVAGSYTPSPLGLGTVIGQKFAMPTYFNDSTQWAALTAIGPQFTMAVLNPNSGPGLSKDDTIAAQVLAAQSQGIKVIGYVSTNYHGDGIHAPIHSVSDAANKYLTWYGVDGIFFDEAVHECSETTYLAGYVQNLKSIKPSALAVLNPGRNSGECLLSPVGAGAVPGAVGADLIVNFEGSAATYETWQPSFWTRNHPASKFWHIVYATPESDITRVVSLSQTRQGGTLFSSSLSPSSLPDVFASIPPPTYFDLLRSSIYGSVVNGPTTTSPTPPASTRLPASYATVPLQAPPNVRAAPPMSITCPSCASGRAPAPQG